LTSIYLTKIFNQKTHILKCTPSIDILAHPGALFNGSGGLPPKVLVKANQFGFNPLYEKGSEMV